MAVFGWRVEGDPGVPQAVLIASPHTSNWDLPHMLAAAFVLRLRVSWLGKHTIFEGLFGGFMRWLGGVPVDRRAPQGLVNQVAEQYQHTEKLVIAVPPAGTRGRRDYWKSGFYWIAHTAQVPILCGYLDYSRKVAHVGFTLMPSGDIRADMDQIRAFYDGIQGRFPKNQTPVLVRDEVDKEAPIEATG